MNLRPRQDPRDRSSACLLAVLLLASTLTCIAIVYLALF